MTAEAKPHTDHETIVQLASQFSKTDVGYGRDELGRLRHWHKWAETHPQRDETVHVCHGQAEWEHVNSNKGEECLSVISWNILSDTWYEKEVESGAYSHTPREHGVWEGRFPILLRWISRLRPDVLALQEVDFTKFNSHLLPKLREMGYDGLVQRAKKQSADQPCGVATFWLTSKLELLEHRHFSRSMATHYSYKQNEKKHVCVANVHLESSQSEQGAEKRARQLNSPLEWASRVAPTAAVLVCGDCNTGADASLFHVLRTHRWHGHDFASVYEHPVTSQTLPVNRATFAVPGHHYVIDHMLYSHDSTSLRVALDGLSPSEIEQHLGSGFEKGFPNEFVPSDHLPIGAIFNVFDAKEPENKTTEVPCLEENRKEEIERQWRAMETARPLHRKGKPTPDEIASRREYARKVKEWKSTFDGNVAEMEFAELLAKGKKPK